MLVIIDTDRKKEVSAMYLTVTTEAKEKLAPFADFDLLLDYDDGVGPLSKTGSCTLDGGFRIIAVKPGTYAKDYSETLDSDLGPVRYKDYTDMFMDNNMKLQINPVNKLLKLSGNSSGELTASVAIVDATNN